MLTMICGLPNAGKTSLSSKYGNVLHQDEIGTIDRIISAINQMHGDVIIEGYFGRTDERQRIISSYKGKAKCLFIDITVEESIKRENRNRRPQMLRNAARFFEPPTYDEGWDEILVLRGDDNEQRSSR